MKQGWMILLLATCVMGAARVPTMRRMESSEEKHEKNTTVYCAPTTSCGWSIYNPHYDKVELNITNTYCVCSPDTVCEFYVDNTSANTLEYRCVKPKVPTDS